jgi:hypothetical protein
VGGKEVLVGAVIVDKCVLQSEGVEPASLLDIPRNLLGLRRESALWRVLFDHDDVLMTLERINDPVAIKKLHCVHGHQGYGLALTLQVIRNGGAVLVMTP